MYKVEYEFKPGDTVFLLEDNKVVKGVVKHAAINFDNSKTTITYTVIAGERIYKRNSDLTFPDKDKLIASL